AFITTIALGSVYGALTLVIAPGSTVRVEEPIFNTLGSGFVFNFIPVSVLIVGIALSPAAIAVFMLCTEIVFCICLIVENKKTVTL
ncbi:MAG: hypothetical protein IJY73_01835, partial [Oscillospiraceae bacterium]|nr:hypothetical protein [Oscillospiraceae bacterium]